MSKSPNWKWPIAASSWLMVVGCVQVPNTAVYACGDGCPAGQMCRNGYCFPQENPIPDACVPLTCAQLGGECGPASDGCGRVLDCGACAAPNVCGGGADGGLANRCGCTPLATS